MTIKAAKAIPAFLMHSLFAGDFTAATLKNEITNNYKNVWVISITDPGYAIFNIETPKVVMLQFHDVDPSEEQEKTGERERELQKTGHVLFSLGMARKIVDFILKADRANKEDDLLLVNCMMGISRSGAVCSFAKDILSLDSEEFKKLNPQIKPNGYVLRKLFRAFIF